jgi:hypothetical protein
MKTANSDNKVLFETDIRSTEAGDYKNVVVADSDGSFCVVQNDIENNEVWNTTPVKWCATFEAAVTFAKE